MVQLKSFVKDLAFVQIVNFLIKPLWVLIVDRTVQNQLGEVLYGEYYGAFAISSMLYILSDLGLNNYITKTAFDKDDIGRGILIYSIRLKLFFSLVFMALVLYVGYTSGLNFIFLFWVAINQILLSFSQYLRVWFNISHQFRKESLIGVLDRLCAVAAWLILYAVFKPNGFGMLAMFLGVQTFGYLMAIGVSVYHIIGSYTHKIQTKAISFRYILWECLPYSILAFLMALFTRIQIPLMDLFLGNAAYHKGVYAQGDVILNAGNMMAAIVGAMLLPIFSKLISNKEPVWPIIKVATYILGGSALLVSGFLVFFDEVFYTKYYLNNLANSKDLEYKINTFTTVIKTYVPMALVYVFGTYLTALGEIKKLIWMATFTLVLGVVLNYYLQKDYAAYGAAIASLLSQTIVCFLCMVWSIKSLKGSR